MRAVVWEGSGLAWPGVSWGGPVTRLLAVLGWEVTVVPWGGPGDEHRGRGGVLHVFSGGMEPVTSRSAAMADRLEAVADAVATASAGGCAVVGICLGAQMIAAVAGGHAPRPVAPGGEAGLTVVQGHGRPELVVATAHVAEVPPELLALPGARLLWSNEVTLVQGFALGPRVVGVQFHPELSAREARWAARDFRRALGAPPVCAPARAVAPEGALRAVLAAAGADRLRTAPAAGSSEDVSDATALEAV